MSSSIFLVGMMGAGKTTVGRVLARRIDRPFIDSDHEIETRAGASIPLIFELEGEEGFRHRETDVLRDLTRRQNIVLATGGGSVLRPENRELLRTRGIVIYLRASAHHIFQRVSHNKNRPLLLLDDPRARIEELLRERDALYREVADITIDTGRPHVQYLLKLILDQLRSKVVTKKTQSVLRLESDAGSFQLQQTTLETLTFTLPDIMSTHSAITPPVRLDVDLGERSYPILIGVDLLHHLSDATKLVAGDKIVIVTNDVVAPLYLESVLATFAATGKRVTSVVLPDGEAFKTMESLMAIFDHLLQTRCDRKTTLVALGGGVIGDLVGYAAASFMRGIPFIQIPTTLLSQVDSSVGGKTGINHPLGKNMIGAFYQPIAVAADTMTLLTLPERELSAGLAEVIKYGAVLDAAFFAWIEANIVQLMARDMSTLSYAIRRCCEIKADVVRQDERETGLRAVLNFGHTFGHAIEAGLGYGVWLHGEAVGCGMVMAADLSLRLGLIDQATRDRVKALIEAAGLPVVAPDLGESRWIELMQVDKKNEGGHIRFILMNPLGHAIVTGVEAAVLAATLHATATLPLAAAAQMQTST